MTSPSGSAGRTTAGDAVDHARSPALSPGSVSPGSVGASGPGSAPEPGQDAGSGERSYNPGPIWARVLPPLAGLVVYLWGITTPSFWRDEAATIAAVQRPYPDLLVMLGHVDAVHGLYYSIMWPLVHIFGPSELVLRLPSALATVVAVAFVAAIGRRLVSPWAGLASGLVFVILPVTTRYAQEARPYAMVITLATIVTYLLVRLLQTEPGAARRWLVGYGAGLALLGMMNIFGLLLIPAHAVTFAVHYRRRFRDPAIRRLAVGWVLAAVFGVVISGPQLVLGWMERGQIAWLAVNTSSTGPETVITLPGSIMVSAAIVLVVGVAFILALDMPAQRRRAKWPAMLAQVSLPWLIAPPAILFAASVVKPIYTSRYILMCIPALALIVGVAIAALGKYAGPVSAVVVLLAGLNAQTIDRMPYGHYDNVRALDQIVSSQKQPGDVVVYTNPNAEAFSSAYSYGLGTLPDIGLSQAAIPSDTLAGTQRPLPALRARLRNVTRVWVVEINKFQQQPQMLGLNGLPTGNVMEGLPLRLVQVWHERGDWLLLYKHS